VARTKPSLRPWSQATWLASHAWLGTRPSWHVLGMWNARITLPAPSGLPFVGSPSRPRAKPSPCASAPK
jgi:hypothetical protein